MKTKLFLFFLTVSLFLFPFIAQAADCGSYSSYVDKLKCVLTNIAVVMYIIAGGLALIVMIIGGITYMTAGGTEDNINKAKKIITNGLIGAAIVLCAGFILDLLAEFLAPLL